MLVKSRQHDVLCMSPPFVLSRQEKKPFSMNPNADIFRSMYPQQAMSMTQQQQLHAAGQMAAAGGGQAMPSAHDSKFYSQSMQQSSDYQGTYSHSILCYSYTEFKLVKC